MSAASPQPLDESRSSLGSRLWLLLAAQTAFGLAWSTFLIQPKFLAQSLGATTAQIGLVTATSTFAGAGVIPIASSLIDRLGRKPLIFTGALLTGIVALGFLWVDSMGPLVFFLHAGLGASFVLTFNAAIAMATDTEPLAHMGRVIGIIGAVNMTTNAAGSVIAERLADLRGWQSAFYLSAALSVIAVLVASRLSDARRPSAVPASDLSIASVVRGPLGRVLWVSLAMGGTFVALFTFVQPHALALGAKNVSTFYVGFTGSAVIMRLGFGGLGDRFGRARVSAIALVLYGGVTFAGAWLDPELLWLYGAFFGLAHGVAYPTMNALAIERAPSGARGRAITLFNGVFNLGSAVAALAWGVLAERAGIASVFLPAGMLGFVALYVLVAGGVGPTPQVATGR